MLFVANPLEVGLSFSPPWATGWMNDCPQSQSTWEDEVGYWNGTVAVRRGTIDCVVWLVSKRTFLCLISHSICTSVFQIQLPWPNGWGTYRLFQRHYCNFSATKGSIVHAPPEREQRRPATPPQTIGHYLYLLKWLGLEESTCPEEKEICGDAPFNKSGLSSRISRNRNELNTDIQIFDYVRLRLPQFIHPHSPSPHWYSGYLRSVPWSINYAQAEIKYTHIIRLELHRINIDLMWFPRIPFLRECIPQLISHPSFVPLSRRKPIGMIKISLQSNPS